MLSALAFLNPWLLATLVTLPVIYWLLRAVPPRPARVNFPPTRILVGLENEEKTADKTPWWLTLIRLLAAAFVIFALAEPILNPSKEAALKGTGPVVILADNDWASAAHWAERSAMIERLIAQAASQRRTVVVLGTAATTKTLNPKIEAPGDARTTAAALIPQPFAPNRAEAIAALETALNVAGATSPSIIWLHDGVDHKNDAAEIAAKLTKLAGDGSLSIVDESKGSEALGLAARLGEKGKLEAVLHQASGTAREGPVHAFSARGERLGEAAFKLKSGENSSVVAFDLPLELRNQVARIEIPSEHTAGAVSLIDAATQWHRVGLISGESREQAQPLLAPLYYLQKALLPYAEIAISNEANFAQALDTIMKQNVSVLMLADIGTLTGEPQKRIEEFLKHGGVLVRFAGPRLEKGGDELVSVPLRSGGRSLGGALSWSTPQPLAPFDEQSPFAGLAIPPDVTIKRQVLADPAKLTPQVEIWARLKDGTPLVTATRRGEGRIVMFHVTANSDWSNLPISGLFVEMLRRISTMGRAGAASEAAAATAQAAGTAAAPGTEETKASDGLVVLPPLKNLDGFGALKAPPPTAEPVKAAALAELAPSLDHPPGYYGRGGNPHALNVLSPKSALMPIPTMPNTVQHLNYASAASQPIKPWLLAAALGLLFADILAVLILQAGSLRGLAWRRPAGQAAGFALAIVLSQFLGADLSSAQQKPPAIKPPERPAAQLNLPPNEALALQATNKVTFGYVLSGDRETDDTSRIGLGGLGKVLSTRTAVEPGEPIGVDIVKDEIAFFPILYWPVLETAEALPDTIISKIDAYMKEGGLIIFDTRDFGQGGVNTIPLAGKGGNALQRLLSKLDVPRLEPVPEAHVVTKSFYLMKSFPGRWDGGQLWVEASSETAGEGRKARVADGVTSIMITSNDFAAAWALDERGRPLYPVVPGGEMQREMAFRSGVNIVMHALTGNYKADQVHVPALLERLGQ